MVCAKVTTNNYQIRRLSMYGLKTCLLVLLCYNSGGHAMDHELISISGSTDANSIEQQRQYYGSMAVMHKTMGQKYRQHLADSKILEVAQKFKQLPQKDCKKLLNKMSTRLCLLHGMVCCLPTEITQKIITLMHNNDEKSTSIFCDRPLEQAYVLYERFFSKLPPDSPMDPAYAWSQEERDRINALSQSPWYYPNPVIAIEDMELINSSQNVKQDFAGALVAIRPKDFCNHRANCEIIGIVLGAVVCFAGSMFGVGAVCGACCSGCPGATCVLDPNFYRPVLATTAGFIPLAGCILCLFDAGKLGCSQKITM